MRDELPHSIAVVIEEMGAGLDRPDVLTIRATLYVERSSQADRDRQGRLGPA